MACGVCLSGEHDHAGQAGEGAQRRQEQRGGVRVRDEGQAARPPGEVRQPGGESRPCVASSKDPMSCFFLGIIITFGVTTIIGLHAWMLEMSPYYTHTHLCKTNFKL